MAAKPSSDLASAIRAKGFQWSADETAPLAQLSLAEKKSRLGLTVTKPELNTTAKAIQAATALRAAQPAFAAPAAVDWRNNGGNWTTPIRDQSSCGSCVAFAVVATIESRIKIACKNPSWNPDLSEAHVFYCGCGNCCGTGWNFAPALNFCQQTGVALESAFPYTPGNQPCKQGLTPYVKATAWSSVLAIPDRKNTLATKGPMVAGMAVYNDFFSYRNGVYRHVQGALAGYHAISVVGYDDAQQCWICKNSWGVGWGESGWFRIGYGEALIDTNFAFYDVDAPCPQVVDDCRKYLPYLVKVLQLARLNSTLRACLRYYVCRRGVQPKCPTVVLTVVRNVLLVLRRCPKYHLPFCKALG